MIENLSDAVVGDIAEAAGMDTDPSSVCEWVKQVPICIKDENGKEMCTSELVKVCGGVEQLPA